MKLVCTVFPVLLVLTLSFVHGQKEKSEDEDSPYEFQYNIEKHHHRHEKKENAGEVTGEFGSVSADGIYRVTKYATDENGNFRIIGVTRTRVFPSPFGPQADGDLPGHKSRPEGSRALALDKPKGKFKGEAACSNCRLPDPVDQPGGPNSGTNDPSGGSATFGSNPGSGDRHGKSRDGTGPKGILKGSAAPGNLLGSDEQYPSGGKPNNPSNPGESSGGPLYRFNYVVGYHGHHELGQRDGSKEGGYVADHEDGVRRKVVYEANEFGFQPNLTLHDLAPQDIPSSDPTKDPGLKEYEFKWFGVGKQQD